MAQVERDCRRPGTNGQDEMATFCLADPASRGFPHASCGDQQRDITYYFQSAPGDTKSVMRTHPPVGPFLLSGFPPTHSHIIPAGGTVLRTLLRGILYVEVEKGHEDAARITQPSFGLGFEIQFFNHRFDRDGVG